MEVALGLMLAHLAVVLLGACLVGVYAVGGWTPRDTRLGKTGKPTNDLPARPDSTEEVLRRALHHPVDQVRLRNLDLLVERIRARRLSNDVVDQLLNAPDPAVRLTAANFVGDQAFEVLKSVFEDSRLRTRHRIWAVSILGQRFRHSEKAGVVLISAEAWLLKVAIRHGKDRALALRTLGEIGGVGAVEPLLKLASENIALAGGAHDAVTHIQSRLKNAGSGRLSVARLKKEEGGLSVAHQGGRLSLPPQQKDKNTS